MYPKTYIDSFRTFERTNEVFVAMSFADKFLERWENIFQPAVTEAGLQAYRVDIRIVSDSILTDILAGIGRARLVLVDTSFQNRGGQSTGPNPNVMYELGIAQAMRLPEEVVVVRDSVSTDPAPFDISHIRYNTFDIDNEEDAKETILQLIRSAINAIDLLRDMIVLKVFESLDPDAMHFLGVIGPMEQFDLYPFDLDRKGLYELAFRDSSEAELRTVAKRLIDLGILVAGDPGRPGDQAYGAVQEYVVTDLGRAVHDKLPDGYVNPPNWKEID